MSIALHTISTHHDVPTTPVMDYHDFRPVSEPGVTKYQADLPRGTHLDALVINKQSDVLVVALHGATMQNKNKPPRFEWMRTLRETEYSSMYFSDPCLGLDKRVQLAWYTGWKNFDLYPILADWIQRTATAVNASKILILGSSGGGFASLHIATYLPGSMALTFNCQTSVSAYKVQGTRLSAQRQYLEMVMPHLTPDVPLEELDPSVDWAEPMGERLSALKRYQKPQQNYVYYTQNNNDVPHLEQHYEPFREVVEQGPNKGRIKFVRYDGPEGHVPPKPGMFYEHVHAAIDWMRAL